MRTALERFTAKYEIASSGCWSWQGGGVDGYGQFWYETRMVLAHRWSYEFHVGPIPEGLQIDHLCRNRACVNPEHLEPVTQKVNAERADHTNQGAFQRAKTHCPRGHEYTMENTYIYKNGRYCRECHRLSDRSRGVSFARRMLGFLPAPEKEMSTL